MFIRLTNGSSGSSLGCGTSSTLLYLPWPYLTGLLLEMMDPYESLLVDPSILGGAFQSDPWDAAVPGRVGGFIPSGA